MNVFCSAAIFSPIGDNPSPYRVYYNGNIDVSGNGRVVVGGTLSNAPATWPRKTTGLGQVPYYWTADTNQLTVPPADFWRPLILDDDVFWYGETAEVYVDYSGQLIAGRYFAGNEYAYEGGATDAHLGFTWSRIGGVASLENLSGTYSPQDFFNKLGQPYGFRGPQAHGISGDGRLIVGETSHTPNDPLYLPVVWTQLSSPQALSVPSGITSARATSVSHDASIIVGSASNDDVIRWDKGVPTSIGTLTSRHNLFNALPYPKVSADGQSVVAVSRSNPNVAALWNVNGNTEELGHLIGGDLTSYARDVSADGSVVVGESSTSRGKEAFVWSRDRGIESLQERLRGTKAAKDLEGWQLKTATGVSDDGQVIVGTGINPAGNEESWVAELFQRVYLDWGDTNADIPFQLEAFSWDTGTMIPFSLDGDLQYSVAVPEMRRKEIRSKLQDIFTNAKLESILVVDSDSAVSRPNDVIVYMAEPISNNVGGVAFSELPTLLGGKGFDRFNDRPGAQVVAFAGENQDPAQVAGLAAHEVGHTFGLRHVKGAIDEIMLYEPPEPKMFTGVEYETFEVIDFLPIGDSLTENPLYHLRRYVDGERDEDLQSASLFPGTWDDPAHIVADQFLFRFDTPASDADKLLYDLHVVLGIEMYTSLGTGAGSTIAQFDQITLGDLSQIVFASSEADGPATFRVFASTQPGGLHDVALASAGNLNDGFDWLIGITSTGSKDFKFVRQFEDGTLGVIGQGQVIVQTIPEASSRVMLILGTMLFGVCIRADRADRCGSH